VSSEQGGRVVFARLGWPGYRATLNGRDLPIDVVAKTFVSVDIPAGTKNTELELTWRPPGWKLGCGAVLLGLLGAGGLQWMYLRGRRRDDDEPGGGTPPIAESPAPEPDLAGAIR
jgi:uncharacterized membrane protein YfhO